MSLTFQLSATASVVEDLLALNASVLPGMGRRDHSAWVMNILAHILGPWLCSADCAGRSLVAADGNAIILTAAIADPGYLTFTIDASTLPRGRVSAPAAAFAVARLFGPSVNALAYAGPLAPRALWRIAGDGLAWGWVKAGAADRAQLVLSSFGAPYANHQLQIENGQVVRRGGCCRYLSISGQTCATCPLRRAHPDPIRAKQA